jgi:hypothetical protein
MGRAQNADSAQKNSCIQPYSVDTICRLQLSAVANGRSKLLQDSHGGFPIYAGVCDANPLLQTARSFRWHFLVSFVDVRFNHYAYDAVFSGSYLVCNCLGNLGLIAVVFIGVS